MAEPWFSIPSWGFRVGPLTTDEESRRAADEEWERIKALQREVARSGVDLKGRSRMGNVPTGGIKAATGATPEEVAATAMPTGETDPNQYPGVGGDPGGGMPDWLRRILFEKPSSWMGGGDAAATPAQMARPGPIPMGGYTPPAPQPLPVAATDPWAGVREDSVVPEDPIEKLLRLMENPTTTNPSQDKADAYAEREMTRTRLLAQLAFASGLTKMGGAGWEGMGEGFAAAAGVYDKGFARYQSALQDSADRYAQSTKEQDDRRFAVAKARIDIDQAKKERERKTWADHQARIDKMFGVEADANKSDLAPSDPEATQDLFRRWGLADELGQYIPPGTIDIIKEKKA